MSVAVAYFCRGVDEREKIGRKKTWKVHYDIAVGWQAKKWISFGPEQTNFVRKTALHWVQILKKYKVQRDQNFLQIQCRVPRGAVGPTAWPRGCLLSERFGHQFKGLCYFTNWKERVWRAVRYVSNQQESARLDSDAGECRAVTELGRPQAERCSSQKAVLQRSEPSGRGVQTHYRAGESFTVQRRGEGRVGGVCVRVCVCVTQRERERERMDRYRDAWLNPGWVCTTGTR